MCAASVTQPADIEQEQNGLYKTERDSCIDFPEFKMIKVDMYDNFQESGHQPKSSCH
jgi:hypothetical protein